MAVILCTISIVITLFSINGLRHIREVGSTVSEKNLPGVIQTSTMNYLPMINMVRLYRLLDSSDPAELKAIEEATLEDTRKFYEADKIYKATLQTPEEMAHYERLQEVHNHYLALRAQFLSLLKSDPQQAKKILTVDMVKALNDFSEETLMLLDQSAEAGQAGGVQMIESVNSTTNQLIIIGIICIIAGIVLAYVITVGLNQRLRGVAGSLTQVAKLVGTAAGLVAESSQSLAEGASEQAASVEETSSSLEEMSSMTQRNAENARNANQLAQQTKSAADRGVEDMQAMSQAMIDIKRASDEVSQIIKAINEIAFQTNILALNAAVEAARAGEAGAGFAVVADEVRNLAQRSAQAAMETSAKIEESIRKTSLGVELNDKVADALNTIVDRASQMELLVTEVASASSEQADGINQLNSAVVSIDKVTQQNTSSAEECASAAEQLNGHSLTMEKSVNALLSIIGGTLTKAASITDMNIDHPLPRLSAKKPSHSVGGFLS